MIEFPALFTALMREVMTFEPDELAMLSNYSVRPAEIAFTESLSLFAGQHEVVLHHKPGPTSGSLWVEVKDERQSIFVGDTLIADQHPFFLNGSLSDWLNSLELMSEYADVQLISGGNGLVSLKDAESLTIYLEQALGSAEEVFREGLPRGEIARCIPKLAGLYPYKNDDAEQVTQRIRAMLETVYDEQKAQTISTQEESNTSHDTPETGEVE
jgi:glyoxylase-like metal-dependent hydrolase (beta-lactamase superfamily II)